MEKNVMNICKRRIKAANLLSSLEGIHGDTDELFDQIGSVNQANIITTLRLRLAAVDHQTSLLRLLQAEDRLVQNLWKIGFGFAGLVVGLLLRPLIA